MCFYETWAEIKKSSVLLFRAKLPLNGLDLAMINENLENFGRSLKDGILSLS